MGASGLQRECAGIGAGAFVREAVLNLMVALNAMFESHDFASYDIIDGVREVTI